MGISPWSVSPDETGGIVDAKFRAHVNIKMAAPEALDEKSIEHRRGTQLKLKTFVSTEPSRADTLGCCIKVPKTKSVKRSRSHNG